MEEFSRRIHAPSPDGTFRQSKWFYERARGQYADARAGLTSAQRKKLDLENPRRQLFTKMGLPRLCRAQHSWIKPNGGAGDDQGLRPEPDTSVVKSWHAAPPRHRLSPRRPHRRRV